MTDAEFFDASLEAVSYKNRSVLIKRGEQEQWHKVSDKIDLNTVQKGAVRVGLRDNKVIYLKNKEAHRTPQKPQEPETPQLETSIEVETVQITASEPTERPQNDFSAQKDISIPQAVETAVNALKSAIPKIAQELRTAEGPQEVVEKADLLRRAVWLLKALKEVKEGEQSA